MTEAEYLSEMIAFSEQVGPDKRDAYHHWLAAEMKSPAIAQALSMVFGWTGADRFYLGQTNWGLAKLFTLGGFGLWWLLDIFLIARQTRIANLQQAASFSGPARFIA